MSEKAFNPEITAFMCIYCSFMAADTASALRIEYPANVKLVKLPCTGKTDSRYLLKAFEDGAEGVYMVACTKGNCHHDRGNELGELRVQHTKEIMDQIGLGGEHLNMHFLSGGQGKSFAVTAKEMTECIRELGTNPLKNNPNSLSSPFSRCPVTAAVFFRSGETDNVSRCLDG